MHAYCIALTRQRLRRIRVALLTGGPHVPSAIAHALPAAAFCLHAFADEESLVRQLRRESFDAFVALVSQSPASLVSIISEIRRSEDVGTLAVIAVELEGREHERISLWEAGSDHVLERPVNLLALRARTIAAVRRSVRQPSSAGLLPLGSASLDMSRLAIVDEESVVALTQNEFDIALSMAQYGGRSISRQHILESMLFRSPCTLRQVDVFVYRIRRKLDSMRPVPGFIQTIRGHGYRLVDRPGAPDGRGNVRAVVRRR